MNTPEISVVIPLYNKARFVERAIKSVFDQKVNNIELIVVDDGSTDSSAHRVQQIGNGRITLIRQLNQGVSAARNKGIHSARADLIAFLDADDEWKPGFLDEILKMREAFPSAGLYGTAYEFADSDGSQRQARMKGIPLTFQRGIIDNYFEVLKKGGEPICTSAAAVPASILAQVGGFPVGVARGEDVYLWGRIALQYQVAFSSFVGAIYHRDASNRACVHPLEEEGPFTQLAKEALENYPLTDKMRFELKGYLEKRMLRAAIHQILKGNKANGRSLLRSVQDAELLVKKNLWYVLSFLPPALITTALGLRRHLALQKNGLFVNRQGI